VVRYGAMMGGCKGGERLRPGSTMGVGQSDRAGEEGTSVSVGMGHSGVIGVREGVQWGGVQQKKKEIYEVGRVSAVFLLFEKKGSMKHRPGNNRGVLLKAHGGAGSREKRERLATHVDQGPRSHAHGTTPGGGERSKPHTKS